MSDRVSRKVEWKLNIGKLNKKSLLFNQKLLIKNPIIPADWLIVFIFDKKKVVVPIATSGRFGLLKRNMLH